MKTKKILQIKNKLYFASLGDCGLILLFWLDYITLIAEEGNHEMEA